MAKPKKTTEVKKEVRKIKKEDNSSGNTATMKELKQLFGDNSVVTFDKVIDHIPRTFSVSPVWDKALGGGIQEGKIWVISGPAQAGKTTTALHFGGKCQKQGRKLIYLGAESRIEQRNVLAVDGIDASQVELVQHSEDRILTAENFLFAAETYIKNEKECVIIIDSISILCEDAEMTGDLGKQKMAGASKLIAQFVRRVSPIIPVQKHILIVISQQYQNPNPQAKKYIAKIGSALQYALSYYTQFTHTEPWIAGASDEDKTKKKDDKAPKIEIGQYAYFNVERSCTAPPSTKIKTSQRFGVGIDEITELCQIAIPITVIKKSGSWYTSRYVEGLNVQGVEALRQYFIDNPKDFEKVKYAIKEMLGEI
jgi:recombination protein RecA